MMVIVSGANSITRSCSLNHSRAPATQVSHLHDADDDDDDDDDDNGNDDAEDDEHDDDDAALVSHLHDGDDDAMDYFGKDGKCNVDFFFMIS